MRILCGTDLLPKTDSALDRAGMLARKLDAELTFLHVVPPTESERLLEQDIERARARLQAHATPPLWQHGRSPHVCVRSGGVAGILVAMARQLDAGLVVLGTHTERPVRDAIAGTLAEKLLGEIDCPVLIVHRMPWYSYRNILLALDCSTASANAVRAAETLVLSAASRASVVHACPSAYETSAELRELLREVSRDSSRYELISENAATSEAIQKVARRLNPDLLILGTRGRGRWRRALQGRVARIVSGARSDVLAVPDHSRRAGWRDARSDRLALDVISGV